MQSIWHFRVTEYWKQMKSVIQKNSIRNVMDMNSNVGGFAAAALNCRKSLLCTFFHY